MTRPVHGVFDYIFGLFLAFSPWIFGFTHQRLAPEFAMVFGAGIVLYSLLTHYELGFIYLLPFRIHRFLDFVVGFILATNWLHFGFRGRAAVVFTLFGVIKMLSVIFSRNVGPLKTPGMF